MSMSQHARCGSHATHGSRQCSRSYQRGSASRSRPFALPGQQVVRGGEADPLDLAALGVRDAGVEEMPAAVVAHDAAGPGGEVVELAGRSGAEGVGQDPPAAQVARDRMPDRRVVVALLRVAERARRLEVEDVDVVAVDGEPEVPQPMIVQAQRHRRGILPSVRGTRIAGWGLALLVPANAVVVVEPVVELGWRAGRRRHRERDRRGRPHRGPARRIPRAGRAVAARAPAGARAARGVRAAHAAAPPQRVRGDLAAVGARHAGHGRLRARRQALAARRARAS